MPDLAATITLVVSFAPGSAVGNTGRLIAERPSRGLHNPGYDFNDDNLPHGAAFWCQLTERFLR
jgi:hypothetical protein